MDLFDLYWILLLVSGILMLGLGISGFSRSTKGIRAVNILFGVGFIGYGLYLGLIFTGGTYIIFFKAFIVPVLLIVNAFRTRASAPKRPMAPAGTAQSGVSPYPNQPYPDGAAGQAQPGQPTTPWQASNQPAPAVNPSVPALRADDVLGR